MYIIGAVVVLLIGVYLYFSNITSPKNVAKEFFDAASNVNADKLYKYIDVEESEFTTKKVFKSILKNEEKIKVTNYIVEKPLLSKDKLSATVKINYLLDGSDDSKTMTIKLVKDKTKKLLLFDNWKVSTNGYSIVKNYEFRLPKDSKLQIEGKNVKSKYLKKDNDNKNLDIYVIPSMFEAIYNIKVTLPIGIELEDKANISGYSYYTARLDEDKISDKVKENIISISKKSLENIYNGVKDKKTWEDVKSQFEYKNGDISGVKEAYEDLLSDFTSSSSTLTELKFTKVEISNLSLTNDGLLYASIKASYDFTISYQSGDETKTNSSDDYDYLFLIY